MTRSLLIALALVFPAVSAAGCAASSPRLKVVGVSQEAPPTYARSAETATRSLLVFVEVLNPTGRPLELSRFRYNVKATRWFDTGGDLRLTRTVRPHARAVLELRVPYSMPSITEPGGVPYTLEGRLYARENRRQRSWSVRTRGRIVPVKTGNVPTIRFRTAASR